MDEEGYVRRRDGNKYFIKLNNDVWEEFKQSKNTPFKYTDLLNKQAYHIYLKGVFIF